MYKLTLECGHTTTKFTGQAQYSRINNNGNYELFKKYRNGQRHFYEECEICGRQVITRIEYVKL